MADTPLMKQYKEIKSQHQDSILFFRLGDFYEMFYEDAIKASKELGLTLTSRNKEKDKIYKEYRAALDAQFEKLNIDVSQRRLETFRNNLKDMTSKGDNKLYREREKLVRAYEHLKSEIATYENNIGFLSIASKKGDGMLKEMERKIETLKEECKLLEQKISLIDDQM